jgi:CspA family cold shock protein
MANVTQPSSGVVREWHDEEGWGVIDSADTPGGCWAHFSHLQADGHRSATPGQTVRFRHEAPGQDGYNFRAVWVELLGA